nr:hypothetical protein [Paraburkholderia sp. BL8N3]
MLATPIHADRRTLGVLAVDCVNPGASRLFADDLHLVMIVATLLVQALLLQRSVCAAHDSMQDDVGRM